MRLDVKRLTVYVKYPYLVDLREYTRDFFGVSVGVAELTEVPGYAEKAVERLNTYLRSRKYTPSAREDEEVFSFYLSLTLAALADAWALSKFIDYEAKRSRAFFLSEQDEFLEVLARKLGVRLEYLGSETNRCGYGIVIGEDVRTGKAIIECYQFRIPVTHYLVTAEKLLTEPKWKLVNRIVKDGYVYLNKRDATRLLEESVKRYILGSTVKTVSIAPEDQVKLQPLISKVLEVVKDVRGFIRREEGAELPRGVVNDALFPPCIKAIYSAILRSEHLSHHQRFALATFLLNIGADTEKVLELFKHSPDFDEKMARYQIEHLAGVRGSRKKYRVYSCEKMRTLGLCVSECGTKSPVQYYWRMLKDFLSKKKSSHNQESQTPQEH